MNAPSTLEQTKPAVEKMAYKLSETAVALGISGITVRRLVERGQLKPVRGLRHLLFSRSEIERFLAQ